LTTYETWISTKLEQKNIEQPGIAYEWHYYS